MLAGVVDDEAPPKLILRFHSSPKAGIMEEEKEMVMVERQDARHRIRCAMLCSA